MSTTDPDARTMKMANGGYDPAYNVQFGSDGVQPPADVKPGGFGNLTHREADD